MSTSQIRQGITNKVVLLVIIVLLLSACSPVQEITETETSLEGKPIHTPSPTFHSGSETATIAPTSRTQVILRVPQDHDSIQAAIDAAHEGDMIIVSPGTYQENIDFTGKEITLQSMDPDDPDVVAATIIDGGGNGSVVTFQSGETVRARLEGFTITNGSGNLYRRNQAEEIQACRGDLFDSGEEKRYCGGGIVVDNSWPTIENNVIRENTVQHGGGGIFVTMRSFPTIRGNTIIENRAAGGAGIHVVYESWPIIEGNMIRNNYANYPGGGLLVDLGSAPRIEGNTISENEAVVGAGIIVFNHASPVIRNNDISYNMGRQNGGAIFVGVNSSVTIENNTIRGNRASIGAGIIMEIDSELTITGNTFIENDAFFTGGGIDMSDDCRAAVEGNTFIGNRAEFGGAIMLRGGTSSFVENNIFHENQARLGGAIYAARMATLPVVANEFHLNVATEAGGAIWMSKDSISILRTPDDNIYEQNQPDDVFISDE
ncbi:MAG: right-handed parallel beta-helix repeat-containing protein [Anaerolineaceae bacterium]|nr:MAG: right-handed parallel beta-helix repeat-containing protein [Anaerolineaceae bacterium]